MVGDSAGGNTDLGRGRGKRVFKAVILSQGQLKIMSNKCQLVKVTQTSCTYVLVPNKCVRHQSFVKMLYFFVPQSIAVGSYKGLFKPLMFENLYT